LAETLLLLGQRLLLIDLPNHTHHHISLITTIRGGHRSEPGYPGIPDH
jgi:hypothetical protein